MAGAAGARAEVELRNRHRDHWPRTLYVYDQDEVRKATGRKLLLESPAGQLAIAAEYKSIEDGELDLTGLQFQIVSDSVHEKLAALAIQFTHPPNYPWAFRLWPLNTAATAFAPVELTEQRYIQLLYLLSRRTAGSSTDSSGVLFQPWEELSHLDDEWPPVSAWPKVKEAFPRENTGPRYDPKLFLHTAQRFAEQRGRNPVPERKLADVELLLKNRPALGAFKKRPNETAVPAPEPMRPTRDVMDRWDRLRFQLDREYRKLWQHEPPSNDGRDMWSPWDEDGNPRWQRPTA